MISRINHRFIILGFWLCSFYGLNAQVIENFSVKPGSKLSVQITTNVNEFHCFTGDVKGSGYYRGGVDDPSALEKGISFFSPDGQGTLFTLVESFECPNPLISKDMQELLKASENPAISFFLESLELKKRQDDSAQVADIEGKGSLSIAGLTRKQTFWGKAMIIDSKTFKIHTQIKMNLAEFGIEPPRKFFGMVQVQEVLQIETELIISRMSYSVEPLEDRTGMLLPLKGWTKN